MKILLSIICFFWATTLLNAEQGQEVQIQKEETQMQQINPVPRYLYKIFSPEQWEQSLLKNKVVNSPIDKEFIHLATEEQLAHVAQKFWENTEYIILKLYAKKLKGHGHSCFHSHFRSI